MLTIQVVVVSDRFFFFIQERVLGLLGKWNIVLGRQVLELEFIHDSQVKHKIPNLIMSEEKGVE